MKLLMKNGWCVQVTGQCPCRPEFGGLRCDECGENHFGNPDLQCVCKSKTQINILLNCSFKALFISIFILSLWLQPGGKWASFMCSWNWRVCLSSGCHWYLLRWVCPWLYLCIPSLWRVSPMHHHLVTTCHWCSASYPKNENLDP